MSLDGITGSGNVASLRGADVVARAGGVLASLATRERYSPLDAFQVAGRQGSQRSRTAADQQPLDQTSTPSVGAPPPRSGTDGGQTGAGRAVSAFVAQSLAQEQDQITTSPPQASQIAAGLRAYARSVGATLPQGDANVEVIPPQLASGHALDLAV